MGRLYDIWVVVPFLRWLEQDGDMTAMIKHALMVALVFADAPKFGQPQYENSGLLPRLPDDDREPALYISVLFLSRF